MRDSRWMILAVAFLARTSMALQFQTVGSLGPDLVGAFAIDHGALGTLIGLYMLPGVVMSLPGGLIGQRFGSKHAVMAGLALMALGGAMTGLASSLVAIAAGRLTSGVGAVLLNVMLTRMITDWFGGRETVTAMALLVVSWPLGIGLGLMAFIPLASAAGWAAVMYTTAGAVLVCLALIAFVYRDPAGPAPTGIRTLAIRLTRREWLLVSIAGLIWGTYNAAYIAFVSFAPEFFATRGFSLAQASSLTSLISGSLIASIPISGMLAQRLSMPNLFMAGGFLVGAVAIVALVSTSAAVPAFIVLMLVIGLPAGLIMALPAEALRAAARASGMGVFYTVFYAGMAVLPGCAGIARDLARSAAAPLLFAAAMLLAALVGLLAFRAVQRGSVVAAALPPIGAINPSPPPSGD
jgi:predicted MFS family arabinose efflux permease